MEGNCWPKYGSVKVVKVIDDHADILLVTAPFDSRGSRVLRLSRFWKADDDGTFLITYNSILDEKLLEVIL